ncbi:ABC transporter substrate-binding protein [Iocasia frigidifontis]|uniref:ABC transporter substrate-binding protein n=1 Tax=Iocasia fonsfrigidae TaxID=2682810 RepID=UPI001E57BFB2|nr:ABC transporter substrate-binding protein [Iocasia fonsfrigidae]
MKKSITLLLVLFMVLIGAVSTCAVRAGADVTITVWCWDPSFNIYAMEEAAEIYAGINPNVKIDVVETAWEDIQTKLTTAVSGGQTDTLPDILLMQDNALMKNVINFPDTFVDITNSGIDFSSFADFKVALTMVDGKNYAVPFDNGAAIIMQ